MEYNLFPSFVTMVLLTLPGRTTMTIPISDWKYHGNGGERLPESGHIHVGMAHIIIINSTMQILVTLYPSLRTSALGLCTTKADSAQSFVRARTFF